MPCYHSELTSKLKASDPELKNYVLELEKENLRLQRQIAKLQVKDVSQQRTLFVIPAEAEIH